MLLVYVVFSYIVSYTNAATYIVTITSGTGGHPGTDSPLSFGLCDYAGKCIPPVMKTDPNGFVGSYTFNMIGNLNTLDHATLKGSSTTDGYDLVKFVVQSGGKTYVRSYSPSKEVYHYAATINLRHCSDPKEKNKFSYGATKSVCKPCNCDNNAKCDPYNGACGTCAAGYKAFDCQVECNDGKYGLRCKGLCSPNCKNVCMKRNGNCECKPGYYGDDCSLPCNSGYYGDYCKTECKTCKGGCNNTNGNCIGGCIPGYIDDKCDKCKGHRYNDSCIPCDNGTFGDVCQHNCSEHCMNVCDTRNGSCSCLPGYTSSTCFQRCPFDRFGHYCEYKCDTCVKGCDNVDGTCNDKLCRIGYIGSKCTPCNGSRYGVNCAHNCNCFKNYACNSSTGNCGRYGCDVGWTGDSTCSIKVACGKHKWGRTCIDCGGCRPNCTLNVRTCHQRCDRDSGVCNSNECMHVNFVGIRCDVCKESMYGRRCDKYCGKCASYCDTVTGHCHHYTCQPGVLGAKCDIPCNYQFSGISCTHKIDTCEKGSCAFCPSQNYFGPKCESICLNCENQRCYKDGTCESGCINGYRGVRCQQACISGTYGRNCENFCGRCADWAECDNYTGECADGCLGHFESPLCTICPVEYFGPECGERCGHCKHHTQCDIFTGICHNGCARGFKGHHCDIREDLPEELDISLDL